MFPQLAGRFASILLAAWSAVAWGASAPLVVDEVAPGVFAHRGQVAELSRENRGDISNSGFIVGERCVAVIDTGSSLELGRALLAAIRQRTDLPVCYVINTHMHFDHLFGNAAFDDGHAVFVASHRLPASLSARAEGFLRTVAEELGPAAAGSRAVYPTQLVETEAVLELGGRRLQLKAWPTAHTDNDLTVYDEASGTLWTGDLLFDRHLPIIDGSIRGWLAVLDQLAAMPVRHMIPGHGAVGIDGRAELAREKAYLTYVATRVRAALQQGRGLRETIDGDDGASLTGWQLVEHFHARNLSAAYTELEWED